MPWAHFLSLNPDDTQKFLTTTSVFSSLTYRTLLTSSGFYGAWDGIYCRLPFILPKGFQCVATLNARAAQSHQQEQGFVLLSEESGDLVVAIRGTQTDQEWAMNRDAELVPHASCKAGQVHSGFLNLAKSVKITVVEPNPNSFRKFGFRTFDFLNGIKYLKEKNQGLVRQVRIMGHSLGGALSILLGYQGVAEGVLNPETTSITTFGSPRVGDKAFAKCFDDQYWRSVIRVVSTYDTVPNLPPKSFGYAHVKGEFLPPKLASLAEDDKRKGLLCAHYCTSYTTLFSDIATMEALKDVDCKDDEGFLAKSVRKARLMWLKLRGD
jgi:triacylglycerol lipase